MRHRPPVAALRLLVRRALPLLALFALCWWASGLVLPRDAAGGATEDAGRQLAFVDEALARGAAEEAQQSFPEGYLFLWVLSGLAHVELGLQAEGEARAAHLSAALTALQALESEAGRAPFSPDLSPPWGAFYQGWTTRLRAGVALLGDADPARLAALEAGCDAIAAAFAASPSPYLASYPGSVWPVDSVVAAAALGVRDQARPPRFADTLAAWSAAAQAHLDPETGALPHTAAPGSGVPMAGSRGTSLVMSLAFLPEVDPAFAADQYGRLRAHFVTRVFGLTGVAEHPPVRLARYRAAGVAPPADVDSGPLVMGISLSASAVAIAAAARNGDGALRDALVHAAELAGLPVGLGQKRVLLGQLPVADAFLAWAKAIPVAGR